MGQKEKHQKKNIYIYIYFGVNKAKKAVVCK